MEEKATAICRGGIILLPSFIKFLDFQTLVGLPCISRVIRDVIYNTPQDVDYWSNVCISFAIEAGLYTPYLYAEYYHRYSNSEARQHFLQVLWPRRLKFPTPPNPLLLCQPRGATDLKVESILQTKKKHAPNDFEQFSVRVACRFRPGESSDSKFTLPFHQFLKLKRKQLADKFHDSSDNAEDSNKFSLGSCCPEEYCDPFLGAPMREPVLLTTSQRIVDRSIALHSILRYGRDPFNNNPLGMDQLIPQPELAAKIAQWKAAEAENKDNNTQLTGADVKPLVDMAACMDADVIQALMDAEMLEAMASMAEHGDNKSSRLRRKTAPASVAAAAEGGDVQDTENLENDEPNDDNLNFQDNQGPETNEGLE